MSEAAADVFRFLSSGGEEEEEEEEEDEEEEATSEEEAETGGRGGFFPPSPDSEYRLDILTRSFFFETVTKSRACCLIDYYS